MTRVSSVPSTASAEVIVWVTLVAVEPYFAAGLQAGSSAAAGTIVSVSSEGAVCPAGIQFGTVEVVSEPAPLLAAPLW